MKKVVSFMLLVVLCVCMLANTLCYSAPLVVYEKTASGESATKLDTYTYIKDSDGKVKLYTAVYDANGNLKGTVSSDETEDTDYLKTTVTSSDSDTTSTFLWDSENTPLMKVQSSSGAELDINDVTITLNGVDLKKYIGDAPLALNGEYYIGLYENRFEYFPFVEIKIDDSNFTAEVETIAEEYKQVITFYEATRDTETKTQYLKSSSSSTTNDYELSYERYSRPSVGTVTINYVIDYLSNAITEPKTTDMSGSYFRPASAEQSIGYEYSADVTVEKGTVAKIKLFAPSTTAQRTMIFVVPKNNVSDKILVADSSGTPLTTVADNNIIREYDYDKAIDEHGEYYYSTSYITKYGEKSSENPVVYTNGSTVTNLPVGYNLQLPDNIYVTGVPAVSTTSPIKLTREIWAVPQKVLGATYIAPPNGAGSKVSVEFYINASAEIILATNIKIEDTADSPVTISVNDASAEPIAPVATSEYSTRYADAGNDFTVAYYLANGFINESDVGSTWTYGGSFGLGGVKEAPVKNTSGQDAYYSQMHHRIRRYDKTINPSSSTYQARCFPDYKYSIFADITDNIEHKYTYNADGSVKSTSYQAPKYVYTDYLAKWISDEEFTFKGEMITELFETVDNVHGDNKGFKGLEMCTIPGNGEYAITDGLTGETIYNTVDLITDQGTPIVGKFPSYTAYSGRSGLGDEELGVAAEITGTGAVISYPDGLGLDDSDTVYIGPSMWKNGKTAATNDIEFHSETVTYSDLYKTHIVDLYKFTPKYDVEVMVFTNLEHKGYKADDEWAKIVLSDEDAIKAMEGENTNVYKYLYVKNFDANQEVTIKTPGAAAMLMTFVKPLYTDIKDASLTSLSVNGTPLAGFDPNVYEYTYYITAEDVAAPVLTYNATGAVTVSNPTEFPGSASITVTNIYGISNTYTINYVEEERANIIYDINKDAAKVYPSLYISNTQTEIPASAAGQDKVYGTTTFENVDISSYANQIALTLKPFDDVFDSETQTAKSSAFSDRNGLTGGAQAAVHPNFGAVVSYTDTLFLKGSDMILAPWGPTSGAAYCLNSNDKTWSKVPNLNDIWRGKDCRGFDLYSFKTARKAVITLVSAADVSSAWATADGWTKVDDAAFTVVTASQKETTYRYVYTKTVNKDDIVKIKSPGTAGTYFTFAKPIWE